MPAWFDRFTKYWASAGLLQDPSDAQANAGWSYIGTAPPTVEQFNSIQQWSDRKDNWLYGQIANTINYNGTVPSDTDLFQLQKSIAGRIKEVLIANRTYYIDAVSGNDTTGTGAIGTPWRTIQTGVNYVVNKIEMAGFSITLQLKVAATYAPFTITVPMTGTLTVLGDRLNPKLYIVKNTIGPAIYVDEGTKLNIAGIAIEASGTAPQSPSGVIVNGSLSLADVAFGPCTDFHMWSSGYITVAVTPGTGYIAYGGAKVHGRATNGGTIILIGATCTIQSSPAFSFSFFESSINGFVSLSGWTSTGTMTGKSYTVTYNSLIGTGNLGASIPGTAGTADAATSGYIS